MDEWFPTLAVSKALAEHARPADAHQVVAFRAAPGWNNTVTLCDGDESPVPAAEARSALRSGLRLLSGSVRELATALGLPVGDDSRCIRFIEKATTFEVAYSPDMRHPTRDDAPVVYRLPLVRKDFRQEVVARVMERSDSGWGAAHALARESERLVATGRGFRVDLERDPDSSWTSSRFLIETPTRTWTFDYR
jgi:hypothetical protein